MDIDCMCQLYKGKSSLIFCNQLMLWRWRMLGGACQAMGC